MGAVATILSYSWCTVASARTLSYLVDVHDIFSTHTEQLKSLGAIDYAFGDCLLKTLNYMHPFNQMQLQFLQVFLESKTT